MIFEIRNCTIARFFLSIKGSERQQCSVTSWKLNIIIGKRLWSSFLFRHWGKCVSLNFNRINFITERLLKSPQNIALLRLYWEPVVWGRLSFHNHIACMDDWIILSAGLRLFRSMSDLSEQSTLSRHLRSGFRPVKYNAGLSWLNIPTGWSLVIESNRENLLIGNQ